MLAFTYYILKVIICSAVLYGYYWMFLRNKVYHNYNRFYLLVLIVISLTLPLLKFTVWHQQPDSKVSIIQMLQVVNSTDAYVDDIILQNADKQITNEQVSIYLYFIVTLAFAFLFIRSLFKIWHLKRQYPRKLIGNINLIYTQDKSTPFSFFNTIFWNNNIDLNDTTGKRILNHEFAHVWEKHSYDKMLINVTLIFFWFNPVFWLLRKEISLVHEFLADKKAVEDGDTSAFAAMILQTTYPGHQFELGNNFFNSHVKRRLTMLTKNKKTKVSFISRLLVLPLCILVFAAFSFKTDLSTVAKDSTRPITVVVNAGHGGQDAGAISGEVKEKDVTLALVKKVLHLNSDPNIRIILTRDNDIYMDPKKIATFTKDAKADLFISVHLSSGPIESANTKSGLEVYVSRDQYSNSVPSKLLASSVIGQFKKSYALPIVPNPIQGKTGIWVIQEPSCPSILIGAGYINNKSDLEYLASGAGQEKFSENLLAAISAYAASPKNFIENAGKGTPVPQPR